MTRIFLIFQYFLHKKHFTAQGLVTVRRPNSVFFFFFFLTNTGHPGVQNCKIIIIVINNFIEIL